MTHGFNASLWNCFEEIKEISVYNEHRPQGIAYSLYNAAFSFLFLVYIWSCLITHLHECVYLLYYCVCEWKVCLCGYRFINLHFFYFVLFFSFKYVCMGAYICVFECVCPCLSSRHNALIINIQCCGTFCQAEIDKEPIAGSLCGVCCSYTLKRFSWNTITWVMHFRSLMTHNWVNEIYSMSNVSIYINVYTTCHRYSTFLCSIVSKDYHVDIIHGF